MTFYGIIIKISAKLTENVIKILDRLVLRDFFTKLHDNFVLKGLSQQLVANRLVTQTLVAHYKNRYC